ncbi:MAG: peptidoglycan-binding protein [Opitutaceae bacterium]|nr:peptidoglycan-binding protein [Opitutaceae bacterium]
MRSRAGRLCFPAIRRPDVLFAAAAAAIAAAAIAAVAAACCLIRPDGCTHHTMLFPFHLLHARHPPCTHHAHHAPHARRARPAFRPPPAFFRLTLAVAVALAFAPGVARAWQSRLVSTGTDGRLVFAADAHGNRIPDFSHAGYHGGGVPIPDVPAVARLAPAAGDNTARIQAALDEIAARPPGADGWRGALRLAPGVYEVRGTLRLAADGVVLAGAGMDAEPRQNTILRRTGASTAPVILAGGGAAGRPFAAEVRGTRSDIVTPRVAVGARSFEVADASGFRAGDAVLVVQPSTEAWIKSVNAGDTFPDRAAGRTAVWKPGELDIRYHRYVTAAGGGRLTLDAPVFDHLDRARSRGYVAKFDDAGTVRHVGVEDLFIDVETEGAASENHAADCIRFQQSENCWVRRVTARHFWHAGVQFGGGSTRATVESCRALDPRGVATGGRFYNFGTAGAQLVLFRDCLATGARHAFVCNGGSLDSGIVFLACVSEGALASSEGHRRWSQGVLFDNFIARRPDTRIVLGLYNRGRYGTAHGWGLAHSVAWRCAAGGGRICVQRPPHAQNYAIGCRGDVSGEGPFKAPRGHIEGTDRAGLEPVSLYLAQLGERLPRRRRRLNGPRNGLPSTAIDRNRPQSTAVDRSRLQST